MSTRTHILEQIDAFLARTGMSHWQFGIEAVRDNRFVSRLRAGKGIQLTTIVAAEAWMAAHEQRHGSSEMTGG